jgi:hypothetical protein
VFTDVLNVNISEGSICYLLNKMEKRGGKIYLQISYFNVFIIIIK